MKRTTFGNSQQNKGVFLFHVNKILRLFKGECSLFKEDKHQIRCNIEKLLVFKDQLMVLFL